MKKIITFLLFVSASIVAHASTMTLPVGQSVTLSVSNDGTAPFAYQWYFQNVGGSSQPITGATAAIYRIPSITSANAGTYRVVVSNSAGSTTSDDAALLVSVPAVAPKIATTKIENK
jgi:Immunoglobulin domain